MRGVGLPLRPPSCEPGRSGSIKMQLRQKRRIRETPGRTRTVGPVDAQVDRCPRLGRFGSERRFLRGFAPGGRGFEQANPTPGAQAHPCPHCAAPLPEPRRPRPRAPPPQPPVARRGGGQSDGTQRSPLHTCLFDDGPRGGMSTGRARPLRSRPRPDSEEDRSSVAWSEPTPPKKSGWRD